jgi:peptidoglycan/xylan/chitin deacetylase (PgdA/CDA1 family)
MKSRARFPGLRQLILILAVAAPIWTIVFIQQNLLLALVPLFVSHALLLYPTLYPHSQWWGPVIRSFATSEKEVWITIDDGPTPEHTEEILNLLDRYEARATFFVIGAKARAFPELIGKIRGRGHEVANHTLTHPSHTFWRALESRIFAEIDGCDEALARGLQRSRSFFRAPVGHKNFLVHPVLRRRGMLLIGWTARGFDTGKRQPEAVAARIFKRTRPGTIVLLHEGHQIERDPEYSIKCIAETLRELSESGYRFVIPASQKLRTNAAGK